MQKFLELILIPGVRLALHVFFRQIQLSGEEKIPADVPVIYTANHMNSVIDGLLARAFLPRDPRPLATATLWDIVLLRPLLTAAGAIPVYRQQDSKEPGYAANNEDMFKACYSALAENDCIVLFPEGVSHAESSLQPLKNGVARIALGAEQQLGPLRTVIIPVGLNFDAKQKFRSRVLITIGAPIDPLADSTAPDPADRAAVGELMGRVEEGIKAVTLNYPSWEEAEIIRRAADLCASQPDSEEALELQLAQEYSLHKELADAYLQLREIYPRRIERIVDGVRSYDRMLKVLSIEHRHVVQQHPKLLEAIYSLKKLSLFLVRLPLALLGIFLNLLPFYATRLVSRIKTRSDRAATTKLAAGFFIFPLCWTGQAMLLGDGLVPGWAWWLLAPLSGVASLLFRERHAQLLEELRSYLRLKTHLEMQEELERRLQTVNLEVQEFLEVARRSQASQGG